MSQRSKKIAVILSGCGHKDGAEIHEATLTLLAIHKLGADYQCFAPNIPQHHVVNFITDEEMDEQRNVLVESARIARGDILDLADFDPNNYDALVLPGGFGVAKNLCDFAFKGEITQINSQVKNAVLSMHERKKAIGALCIAPVILAELIPGARLTIGQDKGTAASIEKMGAKHANTNHGEITIDQENRLVTTPCYMLDSRVDQIAEGAEKLISAILEMV